jgi:hypothetical protein
MNLKLDDRRIKKITIENNELYGYILIKNMINRIQIQHKNNILYEFEFNNKTHSLEFFI